MMKKLLVLLFLSISPIILTERQANSASCPSYPTTLTNGTTADANQVMGNFNTVRNCVLNNTAANGANADITSLTAITTPLAQSEGGTGAALTLGTAGQELAVNPAATSLAYLGPIYTGRNRLVNGAMLLDQANEGASVSVTTGNQPYITDEYAVGGTFASTGDTAQRVAAPAGFTGAVDALKFTVGTGSATLNAGDNIVFEQNIEGQLVGDLAFGGSSAQPVSVSMWLQSSVSGTYGVALQNSAQNRSYATTVALTANVANHVCIANVPGDTTGTWLTSNGIGIRLFVALSMGSTGQGTTGSWQGTKVFTGASQTNLGATTGATFQMSLAQVEVGPNCTAFDQRPFPLELALAQRYFEKSYDIGTALGAVTAVGSQQVVLNNLANGTTTSGSNVSFKVTKRADPALTFYSSSTGSSGKVRDVQNSADVSVATSTASQAGFFWDATANASATQIQFQAQWTADARL